MSGRTEGEESPGGPVTSINGSLPRADALPAAHRDPAAPSDVTLTPTTAPTRGPVKRSWRPVSGKVRLYPFPPSPLRSGVGGSTLHTVSDTVGTSSGRTGSPLRWVDV